MISRFYDFLTSQQDLPSVNDKQDFVVRKRRPVWQVLGCVFAVVAITILTLSILITSIVTFSQIIFILLIGVGTYVVLVIQQSRDLLTASEFQNAIFSSALSYSNKFCIIVKNDNSVMYIDRTLQEMFPNFYKEPRRAIDVLLELGKVSIDERKIIFAALDRRVRDKVIFEITDHKKKTRRLIMSIEPISRPKGFMLMRGHEFVEKRVVGPQIEHKDKSEIFNKNNFGLFSYVMDSVDVGAYMTDQYGSITYVNLTLEQWLNFEEGEIIGGELSLRDIISQKGLEGYLNDLKNFEGDVLFQRKIGGHLKASLNQKAMYDEQGTIIGYIGLVNKEKDSSNVKSPSKNGTEAW